MKRRSATSSPPEPVNFFDENLGRRVLPERLREAGVRVEIHLDHFDQGTEDQDWLEEVGDRWVLFTPDARLRYNRLECYAFRSWAQARIPSPIGSGCWRLSGTFRR